MGILFASISFLEDLTHEIEGLDAVLQIVDLAGNTPLAIRGIIANPESAPMESFGAPIGMGVRDENEFVAT